MPTVQSPTFEEHCEKRDKAESAQLALQKINIEKHADWIVIISFYQVLHLVDAYLVSKEGYQPKSHDQRLDAINSSTFLKPIYGHFDYMYNASMHARYHSWQDYFHEVEVILHRDLDKIVSYISPRI